MYWLIIQGVLLVLKLTETVDWSWWIILLPSIIIGALYTLVFSFIFLVFILAAIGIVSEETRRRIVVKRKTR